MQVGIYPTANSNFEHATYSQAITAIIMILHKCITHEYI